MPPVPLPSPPPTVAVAIFVKTPGLSPLKTRLARTIGCEAAEDFHRLSVAAVAAVVRRAAETAALAPFWAVAEEEGLRDRLWSGFETLWQGSGPLGARLNHVYRTLRGRHGAVLCLGADSPQIPPSRLAGAAAVLLGEGAHERFVMGRSHAGGFYVCGGNAPIPAEAWHEVPYSTGDAADVLARRLRQVAPVSELPPLSDADVFADLPRVAEEFGPDGQILPEQSSVWNWIRRVLDERRTAEGPGTEHASDTR
jgi:glycosyltransferase A (GT-A) superfamily protein (DUF2064 family)